jgi:hypothetical protein
MDEKEVSETGTTDLKYLRSLIDRELEKRADIHKRMGV